MMDKNKRVGNKTR